MYSYWTNVSCDVMVLDTFSSFDHQITLALRWYLISCFSFFLLPHKCKGQFHIIVVSVGVNYHAEPQGGKLDPVFSVQCSVRVSGTLNTESESHPAEDTSYIHPEAPQQSLGLVYLNLIFTIKLLLREQVNLVNGIKHGGCFQPN